MIKSGKIYTCSNSGLYMKVHKVFHRSENYVKFKGSLFVKMGNYLVEKKKYKISSEFISGWIEY